MMRRPVVLLPFLLVVGLFSTGSSCTDDQRLIDSSSSNFDRPTATTSPSVTGPQSVDPTSRTSTDVSRNETVEPGSSADDGTCASECPSGQSCTSGVCVADGALRISLIWDKEIDLDIHVRTPIGEEIYYRNREGARGGQFLKDGCLTEACDSETGPFIETVIWVRPGALGTYDIWAVNYDGGGAANFRVDIVQNGEIREQFNGSVGSSAGARSSTFSVCVGEDAQDTGCAVSETPADPAAACLQELDRLGVNYESWGYSTQSAAGKQCTVEDPIRVSGPINGIDYYYYDGQRTSLHMACPLAVALHKFGNVLKSKGINKAYHIGTFNCRTVAGSSTLSNHSFGNAIDLWGFEGTDGTRYILEDDWEHNTTNPTGAKAQVLYDIGQESHEQRIFNTVLTPNYNRDHDNHFHVDLKAGANFLGYVAQDYYFGDGEGHEEGCGGH